MDAHAVKLFKKRRARRLAERGIRLDSRRYDDGEENENQNVNQNQNTNSGGGGHGNTRLPFGLCKRFGIEVDPSWQPRDAWDALAGNGITPQEAYSRLKAGKDPGVSEKTGGAKEPRKTVKVPKQGVPGYEEVEHEVSYKKRGDEHLLTLKEKGGTAQYLSFRTEQDMLYYLKDHGVEEFDMGDKKVNPQEADLPKRVMTYGKKNYQEVSVSNQKGKFTIFGVGMDGRKEKIKTFDTEEEVDEFFKNKGVAESDIKKSGRKATGPKWLRSEKKEFFEDGGKKYGKVELSQFSGGGMCTLKARDEQNHAYEKKFKTKTEALRYLKEQGVEKTVFNGEEINPQEVDIPKTVGTYKGVEYQDFEVRVGATSVISPILDDYTPQKYAIAFNVRGTDLDGNNKMISVQPNIKREECTDENLRKSVKEAGEKLGIDLSNCKLPKAEDVCRDYDEKVAKEKKRIEDFIQWEKDHPKEAEDRRRAEEWRRRTGKGYESDD